MHSKVFLRYSDNELSPMYMLKFMLQESISCTRSQTGEIIPFAGKERKKQENGNNEL